MSGEIIDLNEIAPPKRLVRIKDKEIDVSIIPFKITLEMMKHQTEFMELGKMVESGKIEDKSQSEQVVRRLETMFEITKRLLKNSDPDIDDDWVDKNLSSRQVILLINRIMEFMFDEFGEPKKAEKPQAKES